MTAESLLITYVQVGVAIRHRCIPREARAGRVVLPRAPALVHPARDERRVHVTQRLTPGPGLHRDRRADRVVRQQRLLGGPATRPYGGSDAAGRPRRGHARPRAVAARRGIRRRRGVRGGATGELRLAGCRLAAPGHDHLLPRRFLHRLRAARPT